MITRHASQEFKSQETSRPTSRAARCPPFSKVPLLPFLLHPHQALGYPKAVQPIRSHINSTRATMESTFILSFIQAYLPWIIVLGSVAFFCLSRYRTWSRLSHIPGPRSASFSKYWLLRQAFSGEMHWKLKGVNDKYGKLVQLHLQIR